jgi:two-component system, cell cycle sensor histidine kinase and response regulator CckA
MKPGKPTDVAKLRRRAPAAGARRPETQRLLHELQVHQIELERQNDELQKSRAEAEAAMARYADLYDFAPVGCFTLERDGTVSQTNMAGARLVGLERHRLLGRRLDAFVSEADLTAFSVFMDQVFFVQPHRSCEVELVRGDQSRLSVLIEAVASADGQECHIAALDVTERRRAEQEPQAAQAETQELLALSERSRLALLSAVEDRAEAEVALRKSEDYFRAIFEKNSAAMMIVNTDTTISKVNSAYCRQTGYTEREVIGTSWTRQIPPEDVERMKEYNRRRLLDPNDAPDRYEFRFSNRNGEVRHGEISVSSIPNTRELVTSFIDITERKQAAEALRRSETQHRTILQTAMDGFWRVDMEGRLLEVNEAYCRMSGYSEQEALAMSVSGLEVVETPAATIARIHNIAAQGEQRFESRHRRKDGSIYDVEVSVQYRPAEGGQYVAFLRDITESKRTEEALRNSEIQFRELFTCMPSGVAIYEATDDGSNFVLKDVNEASLRIEGVTKGDVVGRLVTEIFPGIREMGLLEVFQRVWRTGVAEYCPAALYSDARFSHWYENRVYKVFSGEIVAVYDDVTERMRSDAEVARLMTAIEQAGEAIFITDPQGTIQYVNPAFEGATGYTRQEALGQTPRILKSGQQDAAVYRELWATISTGRTWQGRLVNKRKDGTLYTEDATISPVRDAAGDIVNYVAIKRDVTERLLAYQERTLLEVQLRQSQKVESIGRLAGGIAHDFNNMLGIILGYGESVLQRLRPQDPLRDDVEQIVQAGRRSAEFTRQLLAFSRRQPLQPKVLDLNAALTNLEKMLGRLVGEDIALTLPLAKDLARVKADPNQIEQVILNLVVNARDAMIDGGRLILETANVELEAEWCDRHPGAAPGKYVMLAVSDTGCGMDRETVLRAFEPFFTTKEAGKGTGLGLSTAYGIVKQSGGSIWISSEPGQGTTVKVYLPQTTEEPAESRQAPVAQGPHPGGACRVLVVEDEAALRRLVGIMLSRLGFQVTLAANAGEALLQVEENGLKPDVVITDVVMPGMNGAVMVERLRRTKPDLKTLFMSGYTDGAMVHDAALDPDTPFIQKPFNSRDLSAKLQEVLGLGDDARLNRAGRTSPTIV